MRGKYKRKKISKYIKRRTQGRNHKLLKSKIKQWRENPSEFIEEIFYVKLYWYQKLLLTLEYDKFLKERR